MIERIMKRDGTVEYTDTEGNICFSGCCQHLLCREETGEHNVCSFTWKSIIGKKQTCSTLCEKPIPAQRRIDYARKRMADIHRDATDIQYIITDIVTKCVIREEESLKDTVEEAEEQIDSILRQLEIIDGMNASLYADLDALKQYVVETSGNVKE